MNDLTRLVGMSIPRRNMAELRTEAVAALSTPDFDLVGELVSPHDFSSFSFSPDSQTLLTAGLHGLDFWNAQSLKHVAASEASSKALSRSW